MSHVFNSDYVILAGSALKIVCDIPVNHKLMGLISHEAFLKAVANASGDIRPCGNLKAGEKHGQWVEKRFCRKCKHCERIIEE